MTELLTFLSVSAGIQTRRHTKVCQLVLVCYAYHIYHPSPLPLQWISHRPLHYGQCVCMKTIIQNSFFHSQSPWILLCVLLVICIIIFMGFPDFTLSIPLINITGNLLLQNHCGYRYGEHQDININMQEDISIGLGALLGVYLIFGFLNAALPLKS